MHNLIESNGDAIYNRGARQTFGVRGEMFVRGSWGRWLGYTLLLGLMLVAACTQGSESEMSGVTQLIKDDEVVGTGNEAVAGRQVTVHYTGWLYDASKADKKGSKFDSSRDRNDPFAFRLGAGQVIRGWDEGVAGMKIGGRRRLTIPPDMGYGSRAMGTDIPANSTLVFDVELLDVR